MDLRKGIALGDDHAAHAGGQDGLRAGRRLAVVAARFERDVERGPGRPVAGHSQGLDLGMRPAEPPMPAFADDLRPLGDHAADHRVRLDEPLPPDGQFQGATHVPEVEVGGVMGVGTRGSGWEGEGVNGGVLFLQRRIIRP